jgi:hypothetical protein
MGLSAKSYTRRGFLIHEEIWKFFPIYEEAVSHIRLYPIPLNFFLYEENFIFFFISVRVLELPHLQRKNIIATGPTGLSEKCDDISSQTSQHLGK